MTIQGFVIQSFLGFNLRDMKIRIGWFGKREPGLSETRELFSEELDQARSNYAESAARARELFFSRTNKKEEAERIRASAVREIIESTDPSLHIGQDQIKWWKNYVAYNESPGATLQTFASWCQLKIERGSFYNLNVAAAPSISRAVDAFVKSDHFLTDSRRRSEVGSDGAIRLGEARNYPVLGCLVETKFHHENYRNRFLEGVERLSRDPEGSDPEKKANPVFNFVVEDLKTWLTDLAKANKEDPNGSLGFILEELDKIKRAGLVKCPKGILQQAEKGDWEGVRDQIYFLAQKRSTRRWSKRGVILKGGISLALGGLAGFGYLNKDRLEYYWSLAEDELETLKKVVPNTPLGVNNAEKKMVVGSKVRRAIIALDWQALEDELEAYSFYGVSGSKFNEEYKNRVESLKSLVESKAVSRSRDRVYLDQAKCNNLEMTLGSLDRYAERIAVLTGAKRYLKEFVDLIDKELRNPKGPPEIRDNAIHDFKKRLSTWKDSVSNKIDNDLPEATRQYASLKRVFERDLSEAEEIVKMKDEPVGDELAHPNRPTGAKTVIE